LGRWFDTADWERLSTVWHEGGRMMTPWFQGTGDEFVKVNRERFNHGVRVLHFLGGSSINVEGNRAIGQTKMRISQRAEVEGVVCDVVCAGAITIFLKSEGNVGALFYASRFMKAIVSTPLILRRR